ncbi:MAG: hypothetical protein EZS28_023911 [Streblomastix strix]|uniref:Uncharacterized protein n=1 Tax=Streblomastix strix TaxID=222440 RepID=A0A5J4VDI4_9EUKA|nr:MAG: hypothetical protein EZS28_023911 [Streblomastix strix]
MLHFNYSDSVQFSFISILSIIFSTSLSSSKKGAVVISMISDYEEDNERIEDVDECEKDLENEEECVSEEDYQLEDDKYIDY